MEPVLVTLDGVGQRREDVRVGAVVGREEDGGVQCRGRNGDIVQETILGASTHRKLDHLICTIACKI